MSWRDWFYFGASSSPGPTTLYWRGATADWFTATNWSLSSGGPANGWVPRTIDSVIFNAGGIGNCTLTGSVEIASFVLDADAYTGTMNWANYNMTCHGTFRYYAASSGTTRWSNIGNLTVDANCLLQQSCLETHPKIVTLKTGIAVQNTTQYWFHCKKFIAEASVSLQNLRIGPRLPTDTVNIIDLHSTVTCGSGMEFRFYLTSGVSVTQKGMNYPNVGMYINYCESLTMTMTGNLTLNWLVVHGSLSSDTEVEAPVLDMNGYNLTTTLDVQLGLSTTSGYHGKIKLGSGTHSIGTDLLGHGALTRGYCDFGSSNISIGRDLNFSYVTVVGTNTSTVTFSGSANATFAPGSNSFNDIVVSKIIGNWVVTGDATLRDLLLSASHTGASTIANRTITTRNFTIASGAAGSFSFQNTIWTVSGNWTTTGGTTATTYSGSTVTFTGTGVTAQHGTYPISAFHNVVVAGAQLTMYGAYIWNNLTINVGCQMDCPTYSRCYESINMQGRLNGPADFYWNPSTNGSSLNIGANGYINCYRFYARTTSPDGSIHPIIGATGSAIACQDRFYFWGYTTNTTPQRFRLQGTLVFDCAFRFWIEGTGNILVDCATNNPTLNFYRGIDYVYSSTGITQWTAGTGAINFYGLTSQSISFPPGIGTLDAMTVFKFSGTVTFNTGMTTLALTLTAGGIDLSDNAVTHTIIGNATFNNGDLDMGTSTLVVGGNWDNRGLTTFTPASSTLRMTGNDKLFYSINDTPISRRYNKMDFPVGSYIRLKGTNLVRAVNRVDIAGRIHCEDVTFDIYLPGTVYFTSTGRVSGGVFSITDVATGQGIVQFPAGATIDSSYLTFNCGWGGICSFPPGTYAAGQVEIRDTSSNATPHDVQLAAGSYIFTGNFAFSMSNANSTLTMRNDVNNPSFEFRGNVTFTQTSGVLVWTRGTGMITFGGGNTQSISIGGRTLEAITVNKSANTVTLNSNLTCQNFLHTLGNVTFEAFTFSVQNFTVSGTSGNLTFQPSSTINVAGDYLTVGSTVTYTLNGGVINLNGTGKSINLSSSGNANVFNSVTINGTYTLNGTVNSTTYGTTVAAGATLTLSGSYWVIYGSFHLVGITAGGSANARIYWYPSLTAHICRFYSTGQLNNYSFYVRPQAIDITPTMQFDSGCVIACTYQFHFWTGSETYNRTVRLAGSPSFSCVVEFYMQSIANFTIDCATNNVDVVFNGTVQKYYVTSGRYYWTRGIGTITIKGTTNQNFDGDGNIFEDIIVNKNGGRLIFTGPATFRSFTGLRGDCDFDGYVITVDQNVFFYGKNTPNTFRLWNGISYSQWGNGKSAKIVYGGSLIIWGMLGTTFKIMSLDFVNTPTDTCDIDYAEVTSSIRTGTGPNIDASDGTSIDNGGNIGWTFIIITAIADHFHQIYGSLSYRYQIMGPSQNTEELIGASSRNKGLSGVNRHSYPLVGISNLNILQNVD